MYNEQLIDKLCKARERAKVSHHVIAELWDLKYITSYYYLTKKRELKRSDLEARAVAIIKILNGMVDAGKLPLVVTYRRAKNGEANLQTRLVLDAINDYLEELGEGSK